MRRKKFVVCEMVKELSPRVLRVLKSIQEGHDYNTARLTSSELNEVGLCYWYGNIVPQNFSEAVKWYLIAAGKRCKLAEYNLFVCYSQGKGVSMDMEKAIYWLRRSAKHNDSRGQSVLAKLYYEGTYLRRNSRYFKYWHEKSIKNAFIDNEATVLNNIGEMYLRGKSGVAVDKELAIKCLEKAAEKHYPLAFVWLIYTFAADNDKEKASFWVKESRKCVTTDNRIKTLLKVARYHYEKVFNTPCPVSKSLS
ncbi:MAG: sel1 repeat family protein [Bacteroidaceae bacterium]|nr:sel1 repeat family protein [Bacteroidaceae bacterium]